ncbi:MAG TPA: DUF222 domain-containing protein [Vicinamibacterales bacterium]|nr:DUF222 domain-containing protein [Vicinamibacterales bacterium]
MEDDDVASLASLSRKELAARITERAGHLNAATHRWLVLLAEFDRRQGWSDGFTKSCAHWLNWQCGIDLGAGREKVRVARALESLPAISAAMASGQLSYSKVRALTRVATPATESVLLNVALHGTAHHVERLVRQFRQVQEVAALSREARQQAHRGIRYRYDADGSMLLSVRLPAEAGAIVLRALNAAMREAPNGFGGDYSDPLHVAAETSPHPETPPSYAQRRADALAVLAESFLAHGAEALKGGERQQIVVHVTRAVLEQGNSGRCELDDGPVIAVETARRLGCDASRVDISEDEAGEPLDVGRRTRTIPPALRRALDARDKGCVFPGCTHTRYVDGHHIHHWADGGETKLSNLVSLCRFHHRAVHEGGLKVERCHDGAWRFLKPDGESIEACAPNHTRPLSHWSAVAHQNAEHGLGIDARTAATRWRGERMDYGIAIDSLLYRTGKAAAEERAEWAAGELSAETR